jgi:hypothetical protein
MGSIHLKIRAGAGRLEESYISGRINAILGECGAGRAEITGSFMQDYTITGIPENAVDAVLSMMTNEPGFEPYPYDA